MVNENDLKNIIAQVLSEMNLGGSAPAPAASGAAPAPGYTNVVKDPAIEEGCWEDITQMDLRTQYLVKNPKNREAFLDLKSYSPARLGIGACGARYLTLPQLQFRAAHAAAQDAVFKDVDPAFVESMGLFTVQTQCRDKDEYLTRPDLGRKLSDEAVQTIKEKCKMNPTVQVFVEDGLSSAAIEANTGEVLPALMQGLQRYGINVGTPFFVKYGRVAVEDQISELVNAEVVCVLVGERPGLITATSMSAYLAYKATVGMPEARRTVLSNIHSAGTIPAEAGAHLADIIKKILEAKASGTDLKLS
ncbi:MAG: ethanolamine ammonia-lyase subunit EutC [Lachnospiraceae bacterium]|nr:ethanolamine ammonia-lyase subunit EutC [Lachnospiraceae bacterium]